ncbi:MAG: hypothetical protein ACREBW_10680 [Candidatus Micrarchaeaceae archaeon]
MSYQASNAASEPASSFSARRFGAGIAAGLRQAGPTRQWTNWRAPVGQGQQPPSVLLLVLAVDRLRLRASAAHRTAVGPADAALEA